MTTKLTKTARISSVPRIRFSKKESFFKIPVGKKVDIRSIPVDYTECEARILKHMQVSVSDDIYCPICEYLKNRK